MQIYDKKIKYLSKNDKIRSVLPKPLNDEIHQINTNRLNLWRTKGRPIPYESTTQCSHSMKQNIIILARLCKHHKNNQQCWKHKNSCAVKKTHILAITNQKYIIRTAYRNSVENNTDPRGFYRHQMKPASAEMRQKLVPHLVSVVHLQHPEMP